MISVTISPIIDSGKRVGFEATINGYTLPEEFKTETAAHMAATEYLRRARARNASNPNR